jgi:hypothetical protein
MVAGVRHENRGKIIVEHVLPDDVAYLRRDNRNLYSQNAVEVRAKNGMMIGYVPEEFAVEIAPLLDEGCRHEAVFTKVLTAGRVPIPVVQAYLYRAESTVEGSVAQGEIPVVASAVEFLKTPTHSGKSMSWLYAIIALVALLVLYRLF